MHTHRPHKGKVGKKIKSFAKHPICALLPKGTCRVTSALPSILQLRRLTNLGVVRHFQALHFNTTEDYILWMFQSSDWGSGCCLTWCLAQGPKAGSASPFTSSLRNIIYGKPSTAVKLLVQQRWAVHWGSLPDGLQKPPSWAPFPAGTSSASTPCRRLPSHIPAKCLKYHCNTCFPMQPCLTLCTKKPNLERHKHII